MAYVSKIKDSSNNINYIKYGIYPVVGTQTQSTSSWTGNVDVPSLYNGLTIAYFLPYTASSTVDVTLNLTLSDEQTTTGAIDVYYSDDSRLNSQYDEGSTILLTYWGSGMEVGGVASTAARWVRSDSGEFASHPDWEQDNNSSSAYIENKPSIREGEGENSIVEGQIEQDSDAAIYTIYITGDANATTFSYTTNDTLPTAMNLKNYTTGAYCADGYSNRKWNGIESIDITNHTITFVDTVFSSALTGSEVKLYFKYKEAFGDGSISHGKNTIAGETSSFVTGMYALAAGQHSHAEGSYTKTTGSAAHAEGYFTIASGNNSHAEGGNSKAIGTRSHSEGNRTIAKGNDQHVQGKYNIEDTDGIYADIVGNGTSSERSNAYTLDWDGNGVYAGKVTVGAAPTNDMDVATKKYVDDKTDNNTTYSLSMSSDTLTLAGSDGVSSTVAIPSDNNTTYGISMSSNVITLTGSDGNSSTIALPIYNGSVSVVGG